MLHGTTSTSSSSSLVPRWSYGGPLICELLTFSWLLMLLMIIIDQPVHGSPDSHEFTTLGDSLGKGENKYGDHCKTDLDCGFTGGYCEPRKYKCSCRDEFKVTNHLDKCGNAANVNESCFFNEQCEASVHQTECKDGRCICIFQKIPKFHSDGSVECITDIDEPPNLQYVDPAMIGVLVGMALMFVIICVVLRLFSKARWDENRTIFNTPNTRLMNVSLLKDKKLLHGQERRGSRASVRAPSRQPSMASLRAHSPNASQQGSRTGSRRGSRGSNGNTSVTSGNIKPPSNMNSDPVLENVTVEITEPRA